MKFGVMMKLGLTLFFSFLKQLRKPQSVHKLNVYITSLVDFTRCVKIVKSGSALAGEPCSWLDVEIRCRVTRQLVVGVILQ